MIVLLCFTKVRTPPTKYLVLKKVIFTPRWEINDRMGQFLQTGEKYKKFYGKKIYRAKMTALYYDLWKWKKQRWKSLLWMLKLIVTALYWKGPAKLAKGTMLLLCNKYFRPTQLVSLILRKLWIAKYGFLHFNRTLCCIKA